MAERRYLKFADEDIHIDLNLISLSAEAKMGTRKTSVEINESLLAAVQRVLATKTVKETIEKAFLEILRAQARRQEVEALARGTELADPEIMARAWRQ